MPEGTHLGPQALARVGTLAFGQSESGRTACGTNSETGPPTPERPKVGDTVEDTTIRKFGEVMGFVGPCVQLRPVGGGREWDAQPGNLRQLTRSEALSLGVALANKRSSGERDWSAFGEHLLCCERCAQVSRAAEGCPEGYRARWSLSEVAGDAAALVLAQDEPPAEQGRPSRVPHYMIMRLRDDLTRLVPAIENATLGLPAGDVLVVHAQAGVAEARTRLGLTPDVLTPGTPEPEQWAHAKVLAHSVARLRGYLEGLESLDRKPLERCWRCSRMIQLGEQYTNHDIDAATGAGTTVYLHVGSRCP